MHIIGNRASSALPSCTSPSKQQKIVLSCTLTQLLDGLMCHVQRYYVSCVYYTV